jgi:uncharacterized protein
MSVLAEYQEARREEDIARLRRLLALRALAATGISQREIAQAVGVSQPAISQQLKYAPDLDEVHPQALIEAAGPVLVALAKQFGYTRLAVFGSVARRTARPDSDIDLLVQSPPRTSSFEFLRFKQLLESVLGRDIDLIDYRGLKPTIDDDIKRDAVPL